jgi:protein-L-isoaspartate(D-aspartate) O-methyltransferase
MYAADFPNMRRNMIDCQLRTSGVNAAWLLATMGICPREDFVPADRVAAAYSDRPVPLGNGRALNAPLATGLMLQAAELVADDRVLVIGAATGYLTRLIAGHVASVTALEANELLFSLASTNLKAQTNVRVLHGPFITGAEGNAPYDVVIIDGAVEALPDAIINQLTEGGRIVCGLTQGNVTRLAMGYSIKGAVSLRALSDCGFAPLPEFERAKEFVF